MIHEFLTRLRFLLSRRRGGELDAELQFHIERVHPGRDRRRDPT